MISLSFRIDGGSPDNFLFPQRFGTETKNPQIL
jgi:hypothetical protein